MDSSIIDISEALSLLGMTQQGTGLRWVKDRDNVDEPSEWLALEQAAIHGATGVYLRYFADGRPPKPQIYIFKSDQLHDSLSGADIQHQLWNAGAVPYAFIFTPSEILVYNCGKKPDYDPVSGDFKTKHSDTIRLLGETQNKLDEYAARQFDSGLFWDSEKGQQFHYEQSAYEQLLKQLKNAKQQVLTRNHGKHRELIKRLFVMLILIKYLEEREDESGNTALDTEDFYAGFSNVEPTLQGVLQNADRFCSLLDQLASPEHFNGQIFLISEQEKAQLKEIDLQPFQYFVEGYTDLYPSGYDIGQKVLWRLYSFNHLPIELISHIYEDFLADENGKKDEGVVYTPPYLVQFLVDQCMPLDKPKEQFKILDPACGSGIFLVGTFKRLIQWWRFRNGKKRPEKTDIPELQRLLSQSVFGCDIECEAVRLAYFSLSLALLDALSPKEIWKNVHFENLIGKNLFVNDYFSLSQSADFPKDFDLIIGNPPFKSKFTDAAKEVDMRLSLQRDIRPNVPDTQIALLFLEQSLSMLNSDGNVCLLMSSGPLLYNTKVHSYRRYLLEQHQFKYIFDFTPLRQKLFNTSGAKPPTIAVVASKERSEEEHLYHLIFRRTRASGEKIEFEIDHYDIQHTHYSEALNNPRIWQANFFGGGRLIPLIESIAGQRSLEEFIEEKVKSGQWIDGEGWQECPNSPPLRRIRALQSQRSLTELENEELKILKSKHSADWITGRSFVETSDFTEDGIKNIDFCTLDYFQWPRSKNKAVFKPPHVLIKESVTGKNIPVVFSDEYLTFKDSIFGIHAPSVDRSLLENLAKRLKSPINVSLIWLLSGKVITTREGVPLKADILSTPFPEGELEFNEIEEVLLEDVLEYAADFRKAGEKSQVLRTASKKDLVDFGKYYCRILNAVYSDFRPAQPIIGKEFICYPFILGQNPEMDIPNSIREVEEVLRSLIDHKVNHNLWIKRILRVFERNVIFLYKPNQKRYWLRSIAMRDADETIEELYKQGK